MNDVSGGTVPTAPLDLFAVDGLLDGTRMWITNGSIADVAVGWAQTDDKVQRFVVPTDTSDIGAHLGGAPARARTALTGEDPFR
jgi:glutaryl-CoA dehydrogenase